MTLRSGTAGKPTLSMEDIQRYHDTARCSSALRKEAAWSTLSHKSGLDRDTIAELQAQVADDGVAIAAFDRRGSS